MHSKIYVTRCSNKANLQGLQLPGLKQTIKWKPSRLHFLFSFFPQAPRYRPYSRSIISSDRNTKAFVQLQGFSTNHWVGARESLLTFLCCFSWICANLFSQFDMHICYDTHLFWTISRDDILAWLTNFSLYKRELLFIILPVVLSLITCCYPYLFQYLCSYY